MYDVIIIGAGPAGISAGLYAKRANLNVLIIYKKQENSALEKTHKIENYYGFENGIDGGALYQAGIKQAQNLGIKLIDEEVTNISTDGKDFNVETLKEDFKARSIILATGNKRNKPNINGIDEFEGKGISYCAICDGFFFRNKNVAIIGDGDYAISETNDLVNLVNTATVLTNGNQSSKLEGFRANNVEINNKEIKSIEGTNKVEKVLFKDDSSIDVDGIFIAQGVAGSTEFAKKLGVQINRDKIVVDENMKTTLDGLYACGDCTGGIYQVSKAVYEGTKAGLGVIKYLKNN